MFQDRVGHELKRTFELAVVQSSLWRFCKSLGGFEIRNCQYIWRSRNSLLPLHWIRFISDDVIPVIFLLEYYYIVCVLYFRSHTFSNSLKLYKCGFISFKFKQQQLIAYFMLRSKIIHFIHFQKSLKLYKSSFILYNE